MSIRVSTSSLISGAVVVGDPGHGVLGSEVPTTGEHGGGIAATWLAPEDLTKEVRVFITTWPATGTLFVYEDTSFEYYGGSTTFEVQLYLDRVAVGSPQTVTLKVGDTAEVVGTGSSSPLGTASLAADIALVGVGVALSAGVGSPATEVALSAVGIVVSTGSTNLTADITISAAGLAKAAAEAGMSSEILAIAAGTALSAGNVVLAAEIHTLAAGAAISEGSGQLSSGAAGAMNASGAAQSVGGAALKLTVGMIAHGAASSSAISNLTGGAASHLSATGTASAGGQTELSVEVELTASGFLHAMAAGQLVIQVPIAAMGSGAGVGSAVLVDGAAMVLISTPRWVVDSRGRRFEVVA